MLDGEPDGVRHGKERSDTFAGSCPRIDGAYRNNGSDLAAVVGRFSRSGLGLADWETVVITGHPDVAIQLAFTRKDQQGVTVTLERDRGYDCHTGWLHPDRAAGLMDELKARGRGLPLEAPDDDRVHRYEFYISSNDRKQLVGKLDDLNFAQFDVWCGDGCKGFPIPWSIRRDMIWSVLPDTSEPVQGPPPPSAADERIAAEERALENGPGLTRIEGFLDRVVREHVRPPIDILGTGPTLEGALHVSIRVPDSTWVPQVVQRFKGLAGVRDAREAPLYKSFDENRLWRTVILVTADTAFVTSSSRPR